MNEHGKIRSRHWIAAHRWLVVGMILYGAWLVYVLTTIGFDAEDSVRQFIAQVPGQASHLAIPELPKLRTLQWPDVAMRRDPFQPMVRGSIPAEQKR
jgi:hypothetical protein